ncbi:MAG TPA: tetratricopeptide repeat protein [Candidatus Binatia bacterium]|nr:tetratricopeptide repeat protein [Candidatus Binatia bacterium]
MATTSKRITRKELRQPDWFQVTSENALEQFARHRTKIIGLLAALVVIGLIVAGWQLFKARQNAAAGKEFSSALSLYHAEKYGEAIPEFQKVQGYRWSRYALLAYLYEANSYLGLGEPAKAAAPAERFLSGTGPDTLYRQIAAMTLASIEERQNRCKEALVRYAEAERIKAALQQEARLGKARCAEQLGDLQTAVNSYRDFLKEDQEPIISARLAALEAKVKPAALPTGK